jgi:3-deoxy-7-phosphoheptulonate synthase
MSQRRRTYVTDECMLRPLVSRAARKHISTLVNPHWNGQFSCYDLVARNDSLPRHVVRVGDVAIGDGHLAMMAGPCAVETESQVLRTAEFLAARGVRILRGGAYKPRSSPYAFQGLGVEGLKILAKARLQTGMAVVTEVMSESDVAQVAEYADILQVGARSMENFSLLERLGTCGRAVLLKRGMSATLSDLLKSAQCIASFGNPDIILCEPGIRSFDTATRNVFDVAAVPVLKMVSRLPVIVDPSHAAGVRSLVPILARAAVVVGADGLLVEVHPQPDAALCDGNQSLTLQQFEAMMLDLRAYAEIRSALEPEISTALGVAPEC